MLRIGTGFDAHRFEAGRKLIMGGVEIPFEYGLAGHSDADVLVHAIMDSMLGALSLGDIGEYFPDTDDVYKDISSVILLEKIDSIIKKKGYAIVNIDTVIIAETPKMKPYIADMKKCLADVLAVSDDMIGIKATTTEKMGFTGRKEGIAAQAVCLLINRGCSHLTAPMI